MADPIRVGGRYELGELLGRGGMAEVRKGTDIRLGRSVAVKRLRTDLASDSTFQARFRREAQSAASLNHPSIVSVYDTGEELSHDGTDVAQPYIVMEYVAGRTLRDILKEGRKILPERALEITSGVLSALDYSHRMGIIHRDIKPGNVMLTPSGDVKVMDFGIARAVSDAQSTMTQTAAVVGTAQYLSPEQARGENVDSRSDVYSTGCLLYELLTGRPPFVGDSPVAVAYQHVRENPTAPSVIEPDLPAEIDQIVMKSLAKPVEERYQSASAMKADIDRYLSGQPVHAPAVVPEAATSVMAAAAPAGRHTAEQEAVPGEDRRKRGRGPLLLLLLVLVILIALAAWVGPKLIGSAPEQRSVPTVQGLTQAKAVKTLKRHDLRVGDVKTSTSRSVAKGKVISQDPSPGALVDPGSKVNLVVSGGKPQVTIPNVIGQDKDAAAAQLSAKHLKVHLTQRQSDDPADQVVGLHPGPGSRVAYGSDVTVFYSSGPQQVPGVVGKNVKEATGILRQHGFNVNTVSSSDTTEKKGTVLQQSPKAGETLNQGGTVTLVVSSYEPPSPTPTPTPTQSASPTESPTPTETSSPTESPVIP